MTKSSIRLDDDSIIDELGYMHDAELSNPKVEGNVLSFSSSFLIDEERGDEQKLSFIFKSKPDESISVYSYMFHKGGRIGGILEDGLVEDILKKNKYQLVDIYISNNSAIVILDIDQRDMHRNFLPRYLLVKMYDLIEISVD